DRTVKLLDRLGLKDGEAIESPMVTKSIENAQKRVEENHFGQRKHTLEYDDVMNAQRKVVYTRRHHAVMGERIGIDIINTLYDSVEDAADRFGPDQYDDFKMHVLSTYAIEPPFGEDEYRKMDTKDVVEKLYDAVLKAFRRKTDRIVEVANPVIRHIVEEQLRNGAPEPMGQMRVPVSDGRRTFGIVIDMKEAYETECKCLAKAWQKAVMLVTIDESWKEHLREMDQLRQSVQNASYEQKDPLVIYKVESFNLFKTMLGNMNNKAISTLMRGQIPDAAGDPSNVVDRDREEAMRRRAQQQQRYSEGRGGGGDALASASAANAAASRGASHNAQRPTAPIHVGPKVGRNDPCPCGSGKKFKNCHGKDQV
ncbi:MAG: SEC-C domain-containing protein, partial [Muribaculaceae bacterium]|nr:SEC-C domain-containing protein [Muribaculaceae bacterium]